MQFLVLIILAKQATMLPVAFQFQIPDMIAPAVCRPAHLNGTSGALQLPDAVVYLQCVNLQGDLKSSGLLRPWICLGVVRNPLLYGSQVDVSHAGLSPQGTSL